MLGCEPQPQHPRSLFKVLIQISWLKLVDWRVSLRVGLDTFPLVVVVVVEQRCEFVDFVKLCICHLAQSFNIRANVWLSGWNEVRVVTVSVKCVNRTHQLIQRVKILFGDCSLLIKLLKFGILIVLNGLRGGRHFWWGLQVLPHRNHVRVDLRHLGWKKQVGLLWQLLIVIRIFERWTITVWLHIKVRVWFLTFNYKF